MSGSMMAQKVNPDTLTYDGLNLYKEKAVKMKNAGMIMTACGVGIVFASYITGVLIGENPSDDPTGTLSDYSLSLGVMFIGGAAGIATTAVGIPLWLTGESRKAKAELTLRKFNVAPVGSMAFGLGVKIGF